MLQIKNVGTEKLSADDTDILLIQETQGITRHISTKNLLSGISNITLIKTVAADNDYFIGIDSTGALYKIKKLDLLAGLSSGGTPGGGTTGGTLCKPNSITTSLWIDASDTISIVESSSIISQINDKSGNNRHLSQTSLASRPILIANEVNGLSVIRFNGSTFLSNNSFSPGLTPGSYILIEKNLDGGTGAAPYSFGASSSNNSGILYQNNGGMQPANSPKPPFNSASPRIWVYQITNTGGDTLYLNGDSIPVFGLSTGAVLA